MYVYMCGYTCVKVRGQFVAVSSLLLCVLWELVIGFGSRHLNLLNYLSHEPLHLVFCMFLVFAKNFNL